jgi:prepilin-type N-terminal cleavage/methylation domain-containing protein
MTASAFSSRRESSAQQGFSMMEVLAVVAILITVTAFALPNIMQAVYGFKLRTSTGDLAGLMQQARILAAKNNATYIIRYTTIGGKPAAYIDGVVGGGPNGSYDNGEPMIYFTSSITPAPGAPSGSGGQPAAYVLVGDSGTGTPYDNATTLAFTPRGLPCAYDSSTTPATCATPAANYFGYYLTQTRPVGPAGWGAVIVTKSGRSKVVTWNGTSWN